MTDLSMQKVAIVGAKGQMGSRFTSDFLSLGMDVAQLDRHSTEADIQAALAQCDLLLLSVPVTAVDEVLDAMLPHLTTETILCDVGSVKVQPLKTMVDRFGGPVVGTHPLFGPVIPEGFDPKIAVMPGRPDNTEAAEAVMALFEKCGYNCFSSSPEEHDRAMAFIQGLNYTTTAAFLAAARDVEGIEKYVTPSFKRRLDAGAKMFTQDTELFEIISEANPYLQEVSRKFMSYLSLAAGGDLDLLADRAQWWWRNDESY